MAEEVHAGVAVDHCVQCSALWFDRGEIERKFAELGIKGERAIPPSGPMALRALSTQQACPNCEDRTLQLMSWKQVDFERCPECGGLLLPPSSMHAIAEKLIAESLQPSADGQQMSLAEQFAGLELLGLSADVVVGIVRLFGGAASICP